MPVQKPTTKTDLINGIVSKGDLPVTILVCYGLYDLANQATTELVQVVCIASLALVGTAYTLARILKG